jgi:transitional endoplasmic reticulum ATPase
MKASAASGSLTTLPLAFWGIAGEKTMLRSDESVAGLDKPLSLLLETILLPYTNPSQLQTLGFTPSRGILLHGLPGTGKTTLIQTVASVAARSIPGLEVKVFAVDGSSLLSGVPGETEAKLQGLFREAAKHAGADLRVLVKEDTKGGGDDIGELVTVKEAEGDSDDDEEDDGRIADQREGIVSFDKARKPGLSIVFLDEIDALCPQRSRGGNARVGREGSSNPVTARLVATMLTLMDGIAHKSSSSTSSHLGRVVVIGATNRPEAIDMALRRPGRFDKEVRIDIPNAEARHEILKLQLKGVPVSEELTVNKAWEDGTNCSYLERLAKQCVGFVGADLQALVREAAKRRVATMLAAPLATTSGPLIPQPLTIDDFEAARLAIVPSALRGISTSFERTEWHEIGGMKEVIKRLRTGVEKPLMHPEVYEAAGIPPPRGVLLYGPPGNSKTTLVRALATSLHAAFYSLSGAEVYSPYLGEAERTIRVLFQRARETAPSLIFLDEIDALVGSRGIGGAGGGGSAADVSTGILATLLTEMDGVTTVGGVTVVAATNRPKSLDPALLRPGRLELHVEVPLPATAKDREEILRVHTRKTALNADVDLGAIAKDEAIEGWSGAQLANLCREAAMEAIREELLLTDKSKTNADEKAVMIAADGVCARHFAAALKTLATRATNA